MSVNEPRPNSVPSRFSTTSGTDKTAAFCITPRTSAARTSALVVRRLEQQFVVHLQKHTTGEPGICDGRRQTDHGALL